METRGRKGLSKQVISKINKMYNEGYGVRSIAEKLNLAVTTVNKKIEKKRARRPEDYSLAATKIKENKACNERLKIYPVGTKLRILQSTREGNGFNGNKAKLKSREGIVIFSYKHYFVVQFDNYRESFKYTDVLVQDLEVKIA